MESEQPSQRNCIAGLTPQTFGMFKLGRMTSAVGLKQHRIPNNCLQRLKKKADIMTENKRSD